jgi:hypoxanthine phosphoribosyltransferase
MITSEQIRERLAELASRIEADYRGRTDVVCVGILKGSFMFMADLVRLLTMPVTIDFLAVASYGAASKPGELRVVKDVTLDLKDRPVLVIEDICDTGQSLAAVSRLLSAHGPESVRTCVLLDKPARRQVPCVPDYAGFIIPDAFVVGYGLDYAEKYRHLPYVAAMDPKDLERQE